MSTPSTFEQKRAEAKRVNDAMRARLRETFAILDPAPRGPVFDDDKHPAYREYVRRGHRARRTGLRFRSNDNPDPLTIPAHVATPDDADIVDRNWKDQK